MGRALAKRVRAAKAARGFAGIVIILRNSATHNLKVSVFKTFKTRNGDKSLLPLKSDKALKVRSSGSSHFLLILAINTIRPKRRIEQSFIVVNRETPITRATGHTKDWGGERRKATLD